MTVGLDELIKKSCQSQKRWHDNHPGYTCQTKSFPWLGVTKTEISPRRSTHPQNKCSHTGKDEHCYRVCEQEISEVVRVFAPIDCDYGRGTTIRYNLRSLITHGKQLLRCCNTKTLAHKKQDKQTCYDDPIPWHRTSRNLPNKRLTTTISGNEFHDTEHARETDTCRNKSGQDCHES